MSLNYSRRNLSLFILTLISIFLFTTQVRVYAKPVKTENGLVQGIVEDGLRIYRGTPDQLT